MKTNRQAINSQNARKGNEAQKAFELILETMYGAKLVHIHRITDSAEVRGMTKLKGAFTKWQPADYVICHGGETYFADVKTTKEDRFKFANIEKGQWQAAMKQVAAGGRYYFFVFSEQLGRWFRIPAERIINHTAKSLRFDEIADLLW